MFKELRFDPQGEPSLNITNVYQLDIDLDIPIHEDGYLMDWKPKLPRMCIYRKATMDPTIELFGLATNDDGTKRPFDASVTISENKKAGSEIYTIDLHSAFIEHWRMNHSQSNLDGVEVIIIRAKEITYTAGAGPRQNLDLTKKLSGASS